MKGGFAAVEKAARLFHDGSEGTALEELGKRPTGDTSGGLAGASGAVEN